MRAIRWVVNFTLVITSPAWVLPAFLFFFWADRNELPAWTSGRTWFWENEPTAAPIISPTRLIDDGQMRG